MFRQIAIHPDDWNLQRIFWLNSDREPAEFCLTTVTYGLTCAPFLALRSLKQLVEEEGLRFPKAILPLTKGRYVDDIFGGADSIPEARDTVHHLCMAGGFLLQKWYSNCADILPHELQPQDATVDIEPSPVKLLGLVWKPDTDTFHFYDQPTSSVKLTKRIILSDIARLFDPLGLVLPVLIRAKIILQELWLLKISWDENLPSEIQERWSNFRQQLQDLSQLSIPRWLGLTTSNLSLELHGFSDASNLAMAAAVYIRVKTMEEIFSVRLVCAKTKVAPLKRMTIPRLELSAAVLLSRLVANTRQTLNLHEVPIFLWTDSSVTLTWITTHPSRWKDFIRNRVSLIQELLPTASWRFISGKENPADCASRGIRPDQLIKHELWWNGPRWLADPEDSWPSSRIKHTFEADMEQRAGQVTISIAQPTVYWDLLDRYSSLKKLLRITTICRRFILCLKRVPKSSLVRPLTPEELNLSRLLWVKITQCSWFSNEIRVISRGETLPRSNPLSKLIPFIDREGLLRVGGRLHNARIDTEMKHPVILPRRSPYTTLVINEAHQRTLHGGTQLTSGFIR